MQIFRLKQRTKIKDVASFTRSLTSTFSNNKMVPLYYQVVLKDKDNFLKYDNENFNTKVKLTYDFFLELKWWKGNLFIVKTYKES